MGLRKDRIDIMLSIRYDLAGYDSFGYLNSEAIARNCCVSMVLPSNTMIQNRMLPCDVFCRLFAVLVYACIAIFYIAFSIDLQAFLISSKLKVQDVQSELSYKSGFLKVSEIDTCIWECLSTSKVCLQLANAFKPFFFGYCFKMCLMVTLIRFLIIQTYFNHFRENCLYRNEWSRTTATWAIMKMAPALIPKQLNKKEDSFRW
ncbi:hypothetical protein BD560DRAFT_425043 [Blakeslea trispora]|nr:hypothetical protein BD560DRAFT_425043 [Blakeslea trispora]